MSAPNQSIIDLLHAFAHRKFGCQLLDRCRHYRDAEKFLDEVAREAREASA